MRVAVVRIDPDGAERRGTAKVALTAMGVPRRLEDFRDIDGAPMELPPRASFVVDLAELEALIAEKRERN